MSQDVCLPWIGPDTLSSLYKGWFGTIFWEPRDGPGQRDHRPGQYLIKAASNLAFNCGMVLFSTDGEINRGKDIQMTSFVSSHKTLKTALNTVISSFLFLIADHG